MTETEAPAVRTQTVAIRSEDGAGSEATLFVAGQAPPETIVVCWPAMGVAARYYAGLAGALARPGLCALTADLRGIGSSSVRARRGVDFGYRELVGYDAPAVVAAGRGVYPSARVLLLGHSIGAHISAMYASLHPGEVRGLVFVAAGTPYFKGWPFPGSAGMLAMAQITRVVSTALGYFPGRRFGFFGTEARRLMHEWAALATRGRFEVRGSGLDFESALATVRLPVLALSFEGDTFAPEAAVEHLLAKLPRAEVTHKRLRAADLGAPSLDHFRWAKHPAPVAEVICRWVADTTGVPSPTGWAC